MKGPVVKKEEDGEEVSWDWLDKYLSTKKVWNFTCQRLSFTHCPQETASRAPKDDILDDDWGLETSPPPGAAPSSKLPPSSALRRAQVPLALKIRLVTSFFAPQVYTYITFRHTLYTITTHPVSPQPYIPPQQPTSHDLVASKTPRDTSLSTMSSSQLHPGATPLILTHTPPPQNPHHKTRPRNPQ